MTDTTTAGTATYTLTDADVLVASGDLALPKMAMGWIGFGSIWRRGLRLVDRFRCVQLRQRDFGRRHMQLRLQRLHGPRGVQLRRRCDRRRRFMLEPDDCGVCGGDNSTCGGCTDPEACNYDAEALLDDGSCILGGLALNITVGGGTWDSEIGWTLEADSVVYATGGAGEFSLCIEAGCYVFNMTDSYGDGWNGATYTLTDADGVLVASGDLDSAQNGDGSTTGSDLVQFGDADCGLGCTDSAACNYDDGARLWTTAHATTIATVARTPRRATTTPMRQKTMVLA